MPKMLVDGGVEYEDGTLATESQMAKDVSTFLSWAAEPEHDERKLMGAKFMFVTSLVLFQAAYFKARALRRTSTFAAAHAADAPSPRPAPAQRWKWAPLKSRKVVVDAVN